MRRVRWAAGVSVILVVAFGGLLTPGTSVADVEVIAVLFGGECGAGFAGDEVTEGGLGRLAGCCFCGEGW